LVLIAVICVHVLLLALFARIATDSHRRTDAEAKGRTVLVLISPPKVRPQLETISQAPPRANRALGPKMKVEPRSTEKTAPAAVDWRAAGERAAREAVEEGARDGVRKFGEPRRKTQEREDEKYEFGWSPEPESAGFMGPFPYARLGKRCIIVLSLFSCAIGELPKPNGQLFEHMGDPNAPHSSVPEPRE
jgi:hypothetical protein